MSKAFMACPGQPGRPCRPWTYIRSGFSASQRSRSSCSTQGVGSRVRDATNFGRMNRMKIRGARQGCEDGLGCSPADHPRGPWQRCHLCQGCQLLLEPWDEQLAHIPLRLHILDAFLEFVGPLACLHADLYKLLSVLIFSLSRQTYCMTHDLPSNSCSYLHGLLCGGTGNTQPPAIEGQLSKLARFHVPTAASDLHGWRPYCVFKRTLFQLRQPVQHPFAVCKKRGWCVCAQSVVVAEAKRFLAVVHDHCSGNKSVTFGS